MPSLRATYHMNGHAKGFAWPCQQQALARPPASEPGGVRCTRLAQSVSYLRPPHGPTVSRSRHSSTRYTGVSPDGTAVISSGTSPGSTESRSSTQKCQSIGIDPKTPTVAPWQPRGSRAVTRNQPAESVAGCRDDLMSLRTCTNDPMVQDGPHHSLKSATRRPERTTGRRAGAHARSSGVR